MPKKNTGEASFCLQQKEERLTDYWNSNMSEDKKQNFLTLNVKELLAYFNTLKEKLAHQVLSQAISFAEDHHNWIFWICCECDEAFSDSGLHFQHVVENHVQGLSLQQSSVLPYENDQDWISMIKSGTWKPINMSKAEIILQNRWEEVSNLKLSKNESRHWARSPIWPLSDDSDRVESLEHIQSLQGERSSVTYFLDSDWRDRGRPSSDALLSWIFSGPSVEEELESWVQIEEDNRCCGKKLLQTLLQTYQSLEKICAAKHEKLSYRPGSFEGYWEIKLRPMQKESCKFGTAFGVFTTSNLLLTLFSSIITAFVSPTAAGSGIPEVKAYLNGVDVPGIFSFRTLVIKIIGNIAAVSSSLVVGKAGPMVHTGACIAALLAQGGSRKYGLTWRWLRFFKNDRDRRDLVTCGSASGITAAFRSPVGGVLFALEEMASWWRSALLWRTFFTTAVVAIVLRALIDVCNSGKCGLFGKGGLIMFNVTSEYTTYHLSDVPVVLVLGVIGGVLGSFYNFILEKVLRIYNLINEKGRAHKIILACSISIFTSCLLFGLPWFAPCRPCPADASEACPTIGRSGNYKKYQCPPGHYNDLASLFFNTNDDAIKNLFSFNTDGEFHHLSVLIFFVTSYFLGILSYGIVAPVGLFVPVIVAGASYGRYVGLLLGSYTNLNHGLFAVLGSASLLGGSMRMTVSLCVILLELTNNLLLLPLMMLVLLVSKTVADTFNGNIYDIIMKMKGFPYLKSHVEPYMRQLAVCDVVKGPLEFFNGIEKVRNIVHILQTTGHNGFPVIDEHPVLDAPVLYGLVLRDHLTVLLRQKAFLPTPVITGVYASKQFTANDFSKRSSGKGDRIEDIEVSEEEMEMFIDLHPFTNTSPYTVVETMSLAKALTLFRESGLRHLLVIPKISCRSPVVGILTRHDFMPEHILGLHPLLEKSSLRYTTRKDKANRAGEAEVLAAELGIIKGMQTGAFGSLELHAHESMKPLPVLLIKVLKFRTLCPMDILRLKTFVLKVHTDSVEYGQAAWDQMRLVTRASEMLAVRHIMQFIVLSP
ncbi:hypothetical protein IFM89_012752 [Coptis chinensis]|uniref:Chloride channel protein n=1 Tax=Coptis chinensis TaxID=261450 RepID=A0A835HDT5_9MAGN|nr:hypothetical protein IFM89_012752 [Coptis chinensis]